MILSLIKNRYARLTATEKRIADLILQSPKSVLHMTAKELSSACQSAPSAVIRLCQSLDLDGFSQLKILLAQELGKESPPSSLPAFGRDDDTETVFRKVFQSGINTLRDTLEMMDFEQIDVIAKKMYGARRIFFFGVGTSSVIATDAQYRFAQLGISASACTDLLFMKVTAANLTEGDLAVGISHSGRTQATVDAIRIAKERGARTVAITSFSDSPLYRECDDAVAVFSDEDNYPAEAVSARVAHTCIIDAFMMTLATMHYDGLSAHIEGRNRILGEIRYQKNGENT